MVSETDGQSKRKQQNATEYILSLIVFPLFLQTGQFLCQQLINLFHQIKHRLRVLFSRRSLAQLPPALFMILNHRRTLSARDF